MADGLTYIEFKLRTCLAAKELSKLNIENRYIFFIGKVRKTHLKHICIAKSYLIINSTNCDCKYSNRL